MPDEHRTIPLDRLLEAEWNPKVKLAGKRRDGLRASLDHFGIRDTLKVWPSPDEPGKFVVLDGNQRLGVLREAGIESVECRVLDGLGPEDARLFTAAYDRNSARYDEAKLAALADGLEAIDDRLIRDLLRPDSSQLPPPDDLPAPDLEPAPALDDGTFLVAFELTREGYGRVTAGLLKAKARLVRERRLAEALEGLAGNRADDLVVEVALRVMAESGIEGA